MLLSVSGFGLRRIVFGSAKPFELFSGDLSTEQTGEDGDRSVYSSLGPAVVICRAPVATVSDAAAVDHDPVSRRAVRAQWPLKMEAWLGRIKTIYAVFQRLIELTSIVGGGREAGVGRWRQEKSTEFCGLAAPERRCACRSDRCYGTQLALVWKRDGEWVAAKRCGSTLDPRVERTGSDPASTSCCLPASVWRSS